MASTVPTHDPQASPRDLPGTYLGDIEAHAEINGSARFEAIVTTCEIVSDLITVMASLIVAYWIYHFLDVGQHISYPLRSVATMSFIFALVLVLLLERTGAYQAGNSLLRVRETEGILKASVQSSLFAFALSYFTKYLFSRGTLAIAFVMVPIALVVEKQIVYWIVRSLHARDYGVRRVIIYGAGMTGRRLFSALVRSPKLGLDPVLFVDDAPPAHDCMVFESSYRRRRFAEIVRGPLTRNLIRKLKARMVIIGVPSVSRDKFIEIANEASAAGATISFVPYHMDSSLFFVDYANIDGLPLASFMLPTQHWYSEIIKRVFDFTVSLMLLAATAPLFALVAVIIRLTSAGPAIFVQERVGLKGRQFKLYKFRTMYEDAPQYEYSPKSLSDSRITPIGRFLRRTSLDELPQIINVLKGEMSLVGPRPEMPFIVSKYNALHRLRLTVKPGITGLWQLSADRAYLIHENIEYDLYYIRNRGFFVDFAILLHTVIFAAKGI